MKLQPKVLASAIISGVFFTIFLGWINGGFPFPWFVEVFDLGMFIVNTMIWAIFSYFMILVFKRYGLPGV